MSEQLSTLRLPVRDLDHVIGSVGQRWERLRGQRLLLTGGTGFIGKWLLATFLEANRRFDLSAEVVLLSRNPSSFLDEFPELRNATGVIWVSADVRDLTPEAVGHCSFAVHAATDVAASSDAGEILDTCITGTRRVLEALSTGHENIRLLLLSSGAVYGRMTAGIQVIPEEWAGAPDPLSTSSAYGEGKRVSELMAVMAAAGRPGLEVAIARCFAFVGPYLPLDKHFAIGNFINSAMQNEDLFIEGDGTPLRSYLYAADLAWWLWTMLFDAPNGRAFNVGGTESLSISALANRVNNALLGSGEVRLGQPPLLGSAPQSYVPATRRIAEELNLKQVVDLDEAIRRTARWAAENN